LLALLYAGGQDTKIEGITRLEKLLFLLKQEKGFLANVNPENDFKFFPFRMGPWTNEVYDEVDFLESLGLLSKETDAKSTPADTASLDELFDNMMLEKYQKNVSSNDKGTEIFKLTKEGKEKALVIWNRLTVSEKNGIIDLMQKFNKINLRQLLRYVYQKYPQYATESEIKDSLGLS
jgi:hypothetical protein